MKGISRPLTYPALRTVLTLFSFKKRKELARHVPSVREIEKNIPLYLKSVQITEDWAANCFCLWIDGMVIRFDYTLANLGRINRIVAGKKSIEQDLPYAVIGRCLDYYLNKPKVHINQLTINKSPWPSKKFFPEKIKSLKIITSNGIVKSLKKFKSMRFDRVIIDNNYDNSHIFTLPMVYTAKKLLINSIEMRNDELLQMQLESSVMIHQKNILNSTFTDFCEKLMESENLSAEISYEGTYTRLNFDFKRLLAPLTHQANFRKTVWNRRKSYTLDMKNNKELVLSWRMTGTLIQPKHHVTAVVLEKGTSTDREPGFVRRLENLFVSQVN